MNSKIDIDKFICDCIKAADQSVTIGTMDKVMDGHIFRGALRNQGFTYRKGKIVEIGEEPEEDNEVRYLVCDTDTERFIEVSDKPELKNSSDCFIPVDGTPFVLRYSDYMAYLSHEIGKCLEK